MTPDDLYYEIGVLHVENKVLRNALRAAQAEVERLAALAKQLADSPAETSIPTANSMTSEDSA